MHVDRFVTNVVNYFKAHGRSMPWRTDTKPYRIFVSEIMLQQTQVSRVMKKFPEFLNAFPDFEQLAKSSLLSVLRVWQGMGYNRRGKYLHEAAKIVMNKYGGVLPDNPIILDTLPGIGEATAGSIACFAFNKPTVFIETNIRRVFIYHFFTDQTDVSDKDILPLLQQCLDLVGKMDDVSYCEWYWALMDYGTYLVANTENPNKRSRHYVAQSKFEGSDRQIRGVLLKRYIGGAQVPLVSERDKALWDQLKREGLVQ